MKASLGAGSTPAAGIYLHVPFCSAICPYCDFAVRVGDEVQRQKYVRVLEREIEHMAPRWRQWAEDVPGADSFDTIYFGGGTPSILWPEALERLLQTLRGHFSLADDTTLFLEANPEDVNSESLSAWKALGVEFLSLGVQSFDEEELHFLGRRHSAREGRQAVEVALAADFPTVSVDVIYGLPDQETTSLERNLRTLLDLGPQHVSCYELEIHSRTVFGKQQARGQFQELPNDLQAELFFLTHRMLGDHGLPAYEVSNFARSKAHRSRHNQKYWHHVPYLGLGPGAHSYVGRRRFWNERSFGRWCRGVLELGTGQEGEETLNSADLALETLMLAFRTREGLYLPGFEDRFGADLRSHPGLGEHLEEGHLLHDGDFLRPTLKGFGLADALAASLAPS